MTRLSATTCVPALSLSIGISLLAWSCGSDDDDAGAGAEADAGAGEDLDMQASDFACILDGTKVQKFFLWNPLGHLDDAVAVASSSSGGTYPVGTIIQLVPIEAMVKRRQGWNPTTRDWEFFSLSISGSETTISARGGEEVVNAFGGNCFDCHARAAPQWDLVCGKIHGCLPIPVTDEQIEAFQNADSRCN